MVSAGARPLRSPRWERSWPGPAQQQGPRESAPDLPDWRGCGWRGGAGRPSGHITVPSRPGATARILWVTPLHPLSSGTRHFLPPTPDPSSLAASRLISEGSIRSTLARRSPPELLDTSAVRGFSECGHLSLQCAPQALVAFGILRPGGSHHLVPRVGNAGSLQEAG